MSDCSSHLIAEHFGLGSARYLSCLVTWSRAAVYAGVSHNPSASSLLTISLAHSRPSNLGVHCIWDYTHMSVLALLSGGL